MRHLTRTKLLTVCGAVILAVLALGLAGAALLISDPSTTSRSAHLEGRVSAGTASAVHQQPLATTEPSKAEPTPSSEPDGGSVPHPQSEPGTGADANPARKGDGARPFRPVSLQKGTRGRHPAPSWKVTLSDSPAAAGVAADFTVPGVPAPAGHAPDIGYSAGQGGCSISCITSGVATPAGFDAKLKVTTNTPATIWINVWNDAGYIQTRKSPGGSTSFATVFGDLDPSTEYYAMAVAQDQSGFADHRYGTFTSPGESMSLELDNGLLKSLPPGVPDSAADVAQSVYTYVFVNGQSIAGGLDGALPLISDASSPVEIQVLVRLRHDLEFCQAATAPTVPATSPGFFDEGKCITQVTLAHWVGGAQGAVSLQGHSKADYLLTVKPGFDNGLDAEVKLTLRRVPN